MSSYIIKKIVLTSTALALFTGNIIPPANETFYEDDSDFHKVSSELNSGWGLSFNKAYASCDTEDMVECINITGRNDNDYWDVGGWDDGSGDWTDGNMNISNILNSYVLVNKG